MTLSAAESLAYVNAILQLPDAAGAKAAILAIAAGAGLPTTSWVEGDPDERTAEYMGRAMNAWGAIPAAAVRAMFFALATDPGDVDDFGSPDPSADQTPRPGLLSALGAGQFGTERGGQNYATSFVTFTNSGATASLPFRPGDLTFEASGQTRDDGGTPTYVSTADPSVYNGIGGTKILGPGASITVPVQAVQIGAYGSAPANAIDTCVTQSYGAFTVTGSTTATGQEREARADYIARCLLAPDSNAPGGPTKAYLRAMNTGSDGKVLQRHTGDGPVAIVRAQVVVDNAACIVDCYFADRSGHANATDVESANANIQGIVLGVITDPLGVVPDAITYSGNAATDTTIPINYSVRIKASNITGATVGTYGTPWLPNTDYVVGAKVQNGTNLYTCTNAGTSAGSGGPTGTGTTIVDNSARWDYVSAATSNTTATTTVFDAIATSIDNLFGTYPVGGVEQVSGDGVLYTDEIRSAVHGAVAGLYGSAVSLPSTATTAILLGHVGKRGTTTGVLTVVAG